MNETQLKPSWQTAALAVARPAKRLVMEAGQTSRAFIKRRPLGCVSGIFILLMFFAAEFAPLVAR